MIRQDKVDGLFHVPFARYVREQFGIAAKVKSSLSIKALCDFLAQGHLVMVSVHKSIRTPDVSPPARVGHLVLVVGVYEGGVIIHNPSGISLESQAFVKLPFKTLRKFYGSRGIVLEKPQE